MPQQRNARSMSATVVGYVIVAVIAYLVLRVFISAFIWLFTTILVIALLGGLITLYLKLKLPKD